RTLPPFHPSERSDDARPALDRRSARAQPTALQLEIGETPVEVGGRSLVAVDAGALERAEQFGLLPQEVPLEQRGHDVDAVPVEMLRLRGDRGDRELRDEPAEPARRLLGESGRPV